MFGRTKFAFSMPYLPVQITSVGVRVLAMPCGLRPQI